VLWLLETEGGIGRYRLAKMLGEPDGIVRGMLSRLRGKGLLVVRPRTGTQASRKGLRELATFMRRNRLRLAKRFDQEILGLGPENVIFQISGCSGRIGQGVEQRDAAIKAGARGAVTILYDGKMLNFPGVTEPISRRSRTAFGHLKRELKLRRGDAVLISFGDTWWDAARGGFAAIKTLK